ncbi:hypothetical protein HK405_002725 [Cladochytrium tenue]|nr:hypothetical protein HK405_002725 [Cladochytrium tenue]
MSQASANTGGAGAAAAAATVPRALSQLLSGPGGAGELRVIVEAAANIADTDVTERDIRTIGRSASVSDRGVNELFANSIRREVIASFHSRFESCTMASLACAKVEPADRARHGRVSTSPNFVEAAFSIGRWSISRYRRMAAELRDKCYRFHPNPLLHYSLESLQWSIILEESAKDNSAQQEKNDAESVDSHSGDPITEAEQYVWDRFCVKILGYVVIDALLGQINRRLSAETLSQDVYPTLIVLSALQISSSAGGRGGHQSSLLFIEKVISSAPDYLTDDAIGSCLECCAHTQKADCARALIDFAPDRIMSEVVVTAMIPACINGADHFIALLELFVMDRSMTAELERDGTLPPNPKMKESCMAFMNFVSKSSYLLIFLGCVAGNAKPSTVDELIQFHADPCAAYIPLLVDSHHKIFIAHLFRNVCNLNFSAIAWLLVDRGWVPSSIYFELDSAITLGNQSVVHLLLEYMLFPDDKLDPSGLPIIFRKCEVLELLPKVARRFPKEAAWFLERLSCVPFPASVPASKHAEPEVNIIIALMTVNVADIHSNMNSAWMLEIAGMMVDLELFWPWPIPYSLAKTFDGILRKTPKVHPVGLRMAPEDIVRSADFDTAAHHAMLIKTNTILYTWPKEFVCKSDWWRIMATKAMECGEAQENDFKLSTEELEVEPRPTFMRSQSNELPALEETFWEMLLRKFGLKAKPAVPSTPDEAPKRLGTLAFAKDNDVALSPETAALQKHRASLVAANAPGSWTKPAKGISEATPNGDTITRRRLSGTAAGEELMVGKASKPPGAPAASKAEVDAPQLTPERVLQARRMSLSMPQRSIFASATDAATRERSEPALASDPRATGQWPVAAGAASAAPVTDGTASDASPDPPVTHSQLQSLATQLEGIKDALRALEKTSRLEVKSNRERIKRLEELVARSSEGPPPLG